LEPDAITARYTVVEERMVVKTHYARMVIYIAVMANLALRISVGEEEPVEHIARMLSDRTVPCVTMVGHANQGNVLVLTDAMKTS